MMAPRSRMVAVCLLLLAPMLLAGCTGGDGGGGGSDAEPMLAACPEPQGNLELRIQVDQAQPRVGEPVHFSLYLVNQGNEPVDVPANATLQVAHADTRELVMTFRHIEPRFDIPDQVEPNETLFYTRVGEEFPAGEDPGDYVACGTSGPFHGIKEFRVQPQQA